MKSNPSFLVTLNLFQGPWPVGAAIAAAMDSDGPWMLKQVQHDEFKASADA
jgi:hypothetical protein